MHSDDILNDLKLQRKKWKLCVEGMHSDDNLNDLKLQRKKWKLCIEGMHSDDIWSDYKLQRKNGNIVSKPCILTEFETIWNCREKNENKDA